jgi:hypothetical protein
MLEFLDRLVYHPDPSLPSFSSITYLYIVILGFSLAIAARSRYHSLENITR